MGRLALRPSWAYHDQLWSQRFDRSKSTSIASKSPIPRSSISSSPIVIVEVRQLARPSPIFSAHLPLFSITYEWQRYCTTFNPKEVDHMLRIQRVANGEIVFMISGRLNRQNLAELRTLVDSEAVTFLGESDANRITLQSCPRYVREWILRQKDGGDHEVTSVE